MSEQQTIPLRHCSDADLDLLDQLANWCAPHKRIVEPRCQVCGELATTVVVGQVTGIPELLCDHHLANPTERYRKPDDLERLQGIVDEFVRLYAGIGDDATQVALFRLWLKAVG